ncbi:MAG: PHP domain-containing protein [Clostridia bacterium]|nr:PHP domain-containing protein [Clostridia bacterium]MBQ4243764.1 PHP domain-containing protein [Clostridia bacterium]
MSADLHCHTKLSNSSMGIDDLLVLASKRGVDTIAITDQDCQAGTVRAKIIGERKGITVIPGVELSSTHPKTGRTISILCYLSDSPDRLEGLCRRNMLARKKASQFMVLKAAQKFPITTELVVKCATGATAIFEAHIMHALMECGIADGIHGEVYNELFNPESKSNIIVTPKFDDPASVIAAVHEAGGIAVLAKPGDDYELIDDLCKAGLDGIEVRHPSHTEEQVEALAEIAKKKKLLSISGTEFRGMYSDTPISIGDIQTSDADLKALMSYKSKMKKKAAAAAKK